MKLATGLLSALLLCTGMLFSQTILNTGDMAIVTFNSDGSDAIGILTMVDLTPGTTFLLTDNGFERSAAPGSYTWGNSEEVMELTVNTSTIPAGTVIQIDGGTLTPANLTQTKLFGNFSPFMDQFTTAGDGIFILQGTWNNGTASHTATFAGTYVWGFNSEPWVPTTATPGGTAASRLPPELACANMDFNHQDNFQYLDTAPKSGTKPNLIAELTNPVNWQGINAGPLPITTGPFTIAAGTNITTWTGAADENWFNCQNWSTFLVPDLNTDVIFPTTSALNDCRLQAGDTAMCRDLTFTETGGHRLRGEGDPSMVLEVHGNFAINTAAGSNAIDFSDGVNGTPDGHIYLYGSWTNISDEADFDQGESTLWLVGTGTQVVSIAPQATEVFANLQVNKTSGVVSLQDTLEVEGTLALDSGLVVTNAYHVYVSNGLPSAVTGNPELSWIHGNLHRETQATGGNFIFPVGTATAPQVAAITFLPGHGVNTLAASFSSTIIGTVPNFTDGGNQYNIILDGGIWDIAPTSGALANAYNITLAEREWSFTGPHHTVARRSSPGFAWVPDGTALSDFVLPPDVIASRTGLTSFSEFCLATCVLPVVLNYFEAEILPEEKVALEWGIASEVNVEQYYVERQEGDEFQWIGELAARGPDDYQLLDERPLPGRNHYRLMELTTNGERFEIARTEVYFDPEGGVFKVYPNPFQQEFTILGTAPEVELRVSLAGIDGKSLFQTSGNLAQVNAQLHNMSRALPAGIYLLTILDGTSRQVERLIKP